MRKPTLILLYIYQIRPYESNTYEAVYMYKGIKRVVEFSSKNNVPCLVIPPPLDPYVLNKFFLVNPDVPLKYGRLTELTARFRDKYKLTWKFKPVGI
jgi:hypothetical protein